MKILILTMLIALGAFSLRAQNYDDTNVVTPYFKITLNVDTMQYYSQEFSQEGCDLLGVDTVYAELGAGDSMISAWNNIVGHWGLTDGVGEMIQESPGVYSICFNVDGYFSGATIDTFNIGGAGDGPLHPGDTVWNIGVVFRDGNCPINPTTGRPDCEGALTGKDEYCEDIYIENLPSGTPGAYDDESNLYTAVTATFVNGCKIMANPYGGFYPNGGSLAAAASANPPGPVCPGSYTQLNVNVSGGSGNYTYNWSPSSGLSTSNISDPVANPLVTTIYTVTVTDDSDGNTAVAQVTINTGAALKISYLLDPESCDSNNGSVELFVSDGTPYYSYLWSNGDTTNLANNLAAGGLSVTVTDAHGCKGNESFFVSNICDSVAISGNTNICPGTSTQLTATVYAGSGNYSFSWSPSTGLSDTSIANPVASPSVTTAYTVTMTDNGDSNVSIAQVIIIVSPLEVYGYALPADSCNVNDGAATVYAYNGQSPYTYFWSNQGTTNSITGLAPGSYNVTVTDGNECEGSFSVLVSDPCDSVWPGDANDDGVVDFSDVMQIWFDFGDTGYTRVNATTTWIGQVATPWPVSYWWNFGVNEKFTDCDGNGVINNFDVDVVAQNYTLTHNKTAPVNRALPSDPVLTLVPESDSIYPNSAFKVKVMLGSASNPVDSLMAVAFQVNFDPGIFDTANAQLNITSSWMGASDINLSGFKKMLTGQGVFVMGRIDRANAAGNGEIGELTLMTNASVKAQSGSNAILAAEFLRGMTAKGIPVNFNIQGAIATVVSGINELPMDRSVNISPNPNNGNFQLSIDQPSKQLTIELLNIQGMQLYREQLKDIPSLNKEYNFGDLAKGIYLLKISTENGVVTRQLVVQ